MGMADTVRAASFDWRMICQTCRLYGVKTDPVLRDKVGPVGDDLKTMPIGND